MTPLRRRMLEDMQLRNLSQSTIETYLDLVERFARYFKKSPQQLGAEDVRAYLLHLIREKKASSTVIQIRSALRFLYVCTLKQKWFDDEIPHPKKRVTLPGVITVEEVARMLDVTQNLKHWTILATFYATAVRCKELQQLKIGDIDSQRMVLHVRHGKGGTPRDIALSPALLERLRIYFRRCRPQDWLFPSGRNPTSPLNVRSIRHVFRKAARLAGIKHRVHPHLFRHACATHMLDAGADLRTIQVMLGHSDIRSTARYLHVSSQRLQAIRNPFDTLPIQPIDTTRANEPQS